jgi:hypothetical protein
MQAGRENSDADALADFVSGEKFSAGDSRENIIRADLS